MKKALDFIWGLFKNNLVLKIAALLFAVVLWSYVLADTDPPREKVLSSVPVNTITEQLEAKGLAVSKSLSDLPDAANVRVDVKQSYVKQLTNAAVSLKVDLSQISSPGEYELPIIPTSNNANCQVLEVIPAKVKLVIDYKVPKSIPVELQVMGSVADGYWASEPMALPTGTVEISGAAIDVDKASRAVCYIDVSGLKEWNTKSMDVTILDSDGNPLAPELYGSLPSVIVDMDILPKKTVPVDAVGSITGQDSIASGYEITDIECDPATVEIVGSAEDLANVSSIPLVPYPVSNASSDVTVPLDYAPPTGVTVLAEGKAQVTVTIREKTSTETYNSMNIEIRNLGGGLNAKLEQTKVDVTVLAGISKMSRLRAADVVPYVDLNGLGIGTHTVDIKFEIPEGFVPENFSASATVTVTITRG